MKEYNFLSKYLLKKTSSFFKISISLFIVSLVMVSSATIFLMNQYLQLKHDFLENETIHMVNITTFSDSMGNVRELKFSDKNIITDMLKENPNIEYEIYTKYGISCGITDDKDDIYFIYGISDDAAKVLGLPEFETDTVYSEEGGITSLSLKIPNIEVDSGGFHSNSMVTYKVKVKNLSMKHCPFNLSDENTLAKKLYVSEKFYQKIITTMYHEDWESFIKQYDDDNPFHMQVIEGFYVYLSQLKEVEPTATLLSKEGFNSIYTIKAFDNVSKSAINTISIISSLILLIFLISVINVVLSFKSYFKVQQKDMGILKQMGYSSNVIYYVYSFAMKKPFLVIVGLISIYTGLLGKWLLQSNYFTYTGLAMIILLVMILFVYLFSRYFLKKYTKKDIIYLLKNSKEVE